MISRPRFTSAAGWTCPCHYHDQDDVHDDDAGHDEDEDDVHVDFDEKPASPPPPMLNHHHHFPSQSQKKNKDVYWHG